MDSLFDPRRAATSTSSEVLPSLHDQWEPRFRQALSGPMDAAHGIGHFERVSRWALRLADLEGADSATVWAASWLHDLVPVPKNSPDRSRASVLSAKAAGEFLRAHEWCASPVEAVVHAIEAHSFSAGIPVETLEAAVVQDADRLEALGAIGLSRCLMLGGQMGSQLYHADDPWGLERPLTDDRICVDHFFAKLLGLPRTMKTAAGRQEALVRVEILERFLHALAREAGLESPVLPTQGETTSKDVLPRS